MPTKRPSRLRGFSCDIQISFKPDGTALCLNDAAQHWEVRDRRARFCSSPSPGLRAWNGSSRTSNRNERGSLIFASPPLIVPQNISLEARLHVLKIAPLGMTVFECYVPARWLLAVNVACAICVPSLNVG